MVATRLLRSESLPTHIRHSTLHSGGGAAPQARGVDFIPPAFFKERAALLSAKAARPRSAGATGVAGRPRNGPHHKECALPAAARRLGATGMRCSPSDSVQEQFYTKPFSVAYKEVAITHNLRKLERLFRESDHDGSGEIDMGEFRKALRMPGTHRAFANLGIQPHQCEKIFLYLDDDKSGSLTITEFILGLTDLVGTDIDGTGTELDIEMLSAAFKSKKKQLKLQQKPMARSASTGQWIPTQEMSQGRDQAVKALASWMRPMEL